MKYGKDGSKAISSVSDGRALTLFNEIEGGYKELFNLIDNLVKTCDERLLGKIDEVSENILSKAMELTPLLAKESAKDTRLSSDSDNHSYFNTYCFKLWIFHYIQQGFLKIPYPN